MGTLQFIEAPKACLTPSGVVSAYYGREIFYIGRVLWSGGPHECYITKPEMNTEWRPDILLYLDREVQYSWSLHRTLSSGDPAHEPIVYIQQYIRYNWWHIVNL